jgi:Disulphide bond corrector protein DsbC
VLYFVHNFETKFLIISQLLMILNKLFLTPMKKLIFCFLAILTLTFAANAQKVNPTKWSWALSKPNPAVGETVDIVFTLKSEKGWHHFATDFDEGGPIITTLKFKPNDSYELVGKPKSINPIKKRDEVFEVNVAYFEGKGEIRQTIKVLKDNISIEGTHEGQACSDITQQCVPIKGAFKLDAKTGATAATTTDATVKKKATTSQKSQ